MLPGLWLVLDVGKFSSLAILLRTCLYCLRSLKILSSSGGFQCGKDFNGCMSLTLGSTFSNR